MKKQHVSFNPDRWNYCSTGVRGTVDGGGGCPGDIVMLMLLSVIVSQSQIRSLVFTQNCCCKERKRLFDKSFAWRIRRYTYKRESAPEIAVFRRNGVSVISRVLYCHVYSLSSINAPFSYTAFACIINQGPHFPLASLRTANHAP